MGFLDSVVNKFLPSEQTVPQEQPLNGRSSPEPIGEPVPVRRIPARQQTVSIL